MSVFCLALFDCNILTSFRIFTFATNNKLKLDLEVVFFDCNNTRMGSIVHNSFNDWITDIFRCSLSLIKLCNAKTGYDIKKKFIRNFSSFFITPFNFITLDNRYFLIRDGLFNNNGLTTLQKFLLSQTFFPFKLLKYFNLLFHKSVTHKFLCLVYLPLFSSVLFLRKVFLSFVLSIIAINKLLFIKGE